MNEDIISDLQKLIVDLKNQLNEKTNVIKSLYTKIIDIKDIVQNMVENDEKNYQTKNELETIFNITEDYIVILDINNNIKRANIFFCELINKNIEDLIGKNFYSVFDDDLKILNNKIPEDKFMKTIFFSKKFNKNFLIKSRKLKNNLDPFVYLHITKDITKEKEC